MGVCRAEDVTLKRAATKPGSGPTATVAAVDCKELLGTPAVQKPKILIRALLAGGIVIN